MVFVDMVIIARDTKGVNVVDEKLRENSQNVNAHYVTRQDQPHFIGDDRTVTFVKQNDKSGNRKSHCLSASEREIRGLLLANVRFRVAFSV